MLKRIYKIDQGKLNKADFSSLGIEKTKNILISDFYFVEEILGVYFNLVTFSSVDRARSSVIHISKGHNIFTIFHYTASTIFMKELMY